MRTRRSAVPREAAVQTDLVLLTRYERPETTILGRSMRRPHPLHTVSLTIRYERSCQVGVIHHISLSETGPTVVCGARHGSFEST